MDSKLNTTTSDISITSANTYGTTVNGLNTTLSNTNGIINS